MCVRKSIISGTWYPGEKNVLEQTISNYLNQSKSLISNRSIVGLIAPHAGYMYSGKTAAYAYSQIIDKIYDVVVILSPVHRYPLGKYISTNYSFYETPLGKIPVDLELINKLNNTIDIIQASNDQEHAIEIQLPFLQSTVQQLKILPIMIGHGDVYDCDELAIALYELLENKNYLIIASSDLHHTDDYKLTKFKDKQFWQILNSLDMSALQLFLESYDCSICGRVPIITMLKILEKSKKIKIQRLYQTTSSDITGEKSKGNYSVGYLSAAIY